MKNLFKILLFVIICCNFALTVACQTKEERVDYVVRECQQFLDKDDLDGASNCFQKAILSNPQNAKQISIAGEDAVYSKCLEFKRQDKYQSSIICLEGMTELRSDSSKVHFQLADSYYQYYLQQVKTHNKKDFDLLDKAEEEMKKSIQINSEIALVREIYGEILKEKEDLEGALREHLYAVKLEPNNIRMLIELAIIQEKTGIDEKAIETYSKVLVSEPDNRLTLYFLGKLYQKMGKTDAAIETFEKLVKIDPNYDDTNQRLEYLKYQKSGKNKTPPKKPKISNESYEKPMGSGIVVKP